jgi:16S rRNA U516 pseudouridylate synthase RsuA-like enzyme
MMSAEELEFLKPSKKDNGFQKATPSPAPAAKATPQPEPEPQVSSIDDDLESLESLKAKTREATVRFTVDLSERMHRELRMMAAAKGVKMTRLTRMAIANMLAQLKED